MNCKFCGAELEKGSTLCPACGKDNGEKKPIAKIIVAIVAAVALLAVLAVVVITGTQSGSGSPSSSQGTVPKDGNPEDVTCKGSYTVSDREIKKAHDTVIATSGDNELTTGLLQVYYWSEFYASYSTYMSQGLLNPAEPLDTQMADESVTWQQAYLERALESWKLNVTMADKAKAAGMTLTDTEQQNLNDLEATMAQQAEAGGFKNADAMIASSMGAGTTLEDYKTYVEQIYYASAYYRVECENISVNDADIEAFYNENKELFEQNKLTKDVRWVNVRHILIEPQGGTTEGDTTTYTDAQWEACRAEAQAILDGWSAADATEESFAALANEHSEDPGSNTNGGLYSNVAPGDMVEAFDAWCFDAGRKTGDTGLVKTPYGYHIMYFVSDVEAWRAVAEQNVIAVQQNDVLEAISDAAVLEAKYSEIKLSNVDLMSES